MKLRRSVPVALLSSGLALVPGANALGTAPGAVDHSFGTNGVVDDPVGPEDSQAFAIRQLPGGDFLVGGFVRDSVSGHYDMTALRYTPDGTLDTSFGGGDRIAQIDTGRFSVEVNDMAVQPNAQILLAGSSSTGVSTDPFEWVVARLMPNGTPDTSFGGGDGFDDEVSFPGSSFASIDGIALLPTGKILAVGDGTSSGDDHVFLARYNASGSLDTQFGSGGLVDVGPGGARAMALGPKGTIVVAGFSAKSKSEIWRLNPDGSPDDTFNGTGTLTFGPPQKGGLTGLAVALGGTITAVGDDDVHGIALRVRPGGKLDPSFGTGGFTDLDVQSADTFIDGLVVQPDGKLVIFGGTEHSGNGSAVAVVRLNPDGTPDGSFGGGDGKVAFAPSAGFNQAHGAIVEPSGRIVLAGVDKPGSNLNMVLVGLVGDSGPNCTVIGTAASDRLAGTKGFDVLCGLVGNDLLKGLGGPDYLEGGPGVDTASYGTSPTGVTVDLGAGTETGGQGPDTLVSVENALGSKHADALTGDGGPNILSGLAGNDHLTGLGGHDVLLGGRGNDELSGGPGDDILNGGPGTDACDGGSGSNSLLGCP